MKLLFCGNCYDMIKLTEKKRSCMCGLSSGKYVTDIVAEIEGESAQAIGVSNESFFDAIKRTLPEDSWGKDFTAFTIPDGAPAIRRVDK